MIEGADLQTRIVGSRDKRITGAKAGAEHPELFEPLALQPVKAGAYIHDSLAAGRNGPTNV